MSRQRRSTIAISLFLVFATTQIYLVKGFARDNATKATEPQQPLSGVLSTQGNQAITVNGVSTNAGATILSGANIETPAGVGADINFGQLGSLHIDPNTKVIVEFQNGSIKVTVLQGCVVLRTKRGTRGEVDTNQGVAKTSDGSKDATLPICAPGAVATAPAAAPPPAVLGAKVIVPIFAGSATALALLSARGGNPSPTTP